MHVVNDIDPMLLLCLFSAIDTTFVYIALFILRALLPLFFFPFFTPLMPLQPHN